MTAATSTAVGTVDRSRRVVRGDRQIPMLTPIADSRRRSGSLPRVICESTSGTLPVGYVHDPVGEFLRRYQEATNR
jgi:hypothetical protein